MVGSRDLDRAPARQVQRERLERSHVAHLLNVLHLHGDVLPLQCWPCNLPSISGWVFCSEAKLEEIQEPAAILSSRTELVVFTNRPPSHQRLGYFHACLPILCPCCNSISRDNPTMTATAVIEEIQQMPPEEQSRVIQFAIELARTRQLSGKELTALAQRMVESEDPAEVEKLKSALTRGFYGD